VYGIVALAALVENFFPPAPADLIVTLAAFLSGRGTTNAMTVFWVTWVSNVGGAALVYLLARRLGPAFFNSGLGRRLMSPEAVVTVERNYVRFGLAGLIVARLLPGFRSFTAPFAGLMRLGPVRTLVPIGLASAAWYGGLTFLGARLGQNWTALERLVHGLNRTLGVIAALAAVGIVVWLIRRHRRIRSAQLRAQISQELEAYPSAEAQALVDPAVAAVVALLLETHTDQRDLSPAEFDALTAHFRDRWHLTQAGASLTPEAARDIVKSLAPTERIGVMRRVRRAMFGDADLARREARIMSRVARVLGIE
jgi:membrane protein DedA with SNARE-associated domain